MIFQREKNGEFHNWLGLRDKLISIVSPATGHQLGNIVDRGTSLVLAKSEPVNETNDRARWKSWRRLPQRFTASMERGICFRAAGIR